MPRKLNVSINVVLGIIIVILFFILLEQINNRNLCKRSSKVIDKENDLLQKTALKKTDSLNTAIQQHREKLDLCRERVANKPQIRENMVNYQDCKLPGTSLKDKNINNWMKPTNLMPTTTGLQIKHFGELYPQYWRYFDEYSRQKIDEPLVLGKYYNRELARNLARRFGPECA